VLYMNKLLSAENISEYAVIDFDKLSVKNPRLLPEDVDVKSTLVILMPYRHKNITVKDGLNAGLFARCKDYHGYFAQLAKRLIPTLEGFSGGRVLGFADHSPIDEKGAALMCGLGFMGKNGLLINKRYGSYVFIGEFLFEKRLPELLHKTDGTCLNCGACIKACPTNAICHSGTDIRNCLSFISQKKKKAEEDTSLLSEHRTLWGCDICQQVCPHNKNVSYSPIPYFNEEVIDNFSFELLEGMSEENFKKYAFSYRKREVITQNFLTAVGKYDIMA